MNRRTFLAIFGTSIGLALNFRCNSKDRPPNIVFILADDLGYGDLGCYGQEYTIKENLGEKKNVFMSDIITEKALEFIEKTKNNPFLLYLPYSLVHAPMQIPDVGDYEDKDWPESEKIFAAMLTKLDHYVGLFFKAIKMHGLEDNTLVIFTSDNGPHHEGGHDHKFFNSNGPLRGCKRDFYEGGIRVPFIARWPGQINAGMVEEHTSAFWDFMPTVCDLAGIGSPSGIDGLSYLPALVGKRQLKHDYLYWERPNSNPVQAIRKGKHKAIRFLKEGRIELYDLETDIGETENIADQHPDVVQEMVRLMNEAHQPSADFPISEIDSRNM